MNADKIVFWAIALTAGTFLFWHAGYEAAKAEIQPVEKVYYLTGDLDPLCQAKGRRT